MQVQVGTKPQGGTRADTTRKTINWDNSSDRKWLMNHMHWAMHNNHLVALCPIESN